MADSGKRDKDVPLSTWNNNPGNLRPPKDVVYKGQIGIDPKGFAIFEDPESGRTALINDINIKIKRGINTPDAFIDVYSPAGKENPDDSRKNYKMHMAKTVGINGPTDPFPEGSAEKIADAITGFEAGTWQDSKEQGKAAHVRDEEPPMPTEAPPTENANESPRVEDQQPGGVVPDVRPADMPGVKQAQKAELAALGAGAGAATAGAIETGKFALPLVPNIYSQVMGYDQNINRPATRTSMQRYLNSQHHHRVHLSDLERAFNDHLRLSNPAAEPRRLRTMAEVQEALAAIKPTPDQMVAKPRVEMVPGKSGVFRETGQMTSRLVPGNPGIDLSRYAPNPSTPVRNAVRSGVRGTTDFLRSALPPVARVATGALGGLNALTSGYDTYESVRDRGMFDPKSIGKATKTAGGAMMMIPGLQVPGAIATGVGMIPDEGLDYYNELKKRQKEATRESMQQAFENYPMGN
jgi:hypothetical protein